MNQTDSRVATYEHIQQVQRMMALMIGDIAERSRVHDRSKLQPPEREIFDEFTPKLANATYGSEEYKGFLAAMKPGLDHHYRANRHHPEHFSTGIKGMTLVDLLEMVCDWKAATLRHKDGDLARSIEINQKRFGYGDELKQVLVNTAEMFRRLRAEDEPDDDQPQVAGAPVQPWSKYLEIFPQSDSRIWVRWTGYDGIYRWLHPIAKKWVEEPEQIHMPMFTTYAEARAAADESPEPPMWKEMLFAIQSGDAR